MVVLEEIHDEITLAINITNCPCKCPGCHSKFLWDDNGTELTVEVLHKLIKENDGITCVCFMGGDAEPEYVNTLAKFVHREFPELKVAWYSGRQRVPSIVCKSDFDYLKLGPYIEHLGCLKSKTTNQRLYKRASGDDFQDITSSFWKGTK